MDQNDRSDLSGTEMTCWWCGGQIEVVAYDRYCSSECAINHSFSEHDQYSLYDSFVIERSGSCD